MKSRAQTAFIESGPSRYYKSGDGSIHPYRTGQNTNYYYVFVDTNTILANGGNYFYYSNNIGGTSYQSVFCSGAGCEGMVTVNAGVASMDSLDSGGESQDTGAHWGTMWTQDNGYLAVAVGHYDPWCYNTVVHNNTSNTPSACYNAGDGWNDSWWASY